jgi:hypothetical protein
VPGWRGARAFKKIGLAVKTPTAAVLAALGETGLLAQAMTLRPALGETGLLAQAMTLRPAPGLSGLLIMLPALGLLVVPSVRNLARPSYVYDGHMVV